MRYYAFFTILFAFATSAAAVALNASPPASVDAKCFAEISCDVVIKPPVHRSQASCDCPPVPSHPPLIKHRGIIRVDKADDGTNLGYISKNPLAGARFGYAPIEQALTLEFALPKWVISGKEIDLSRGDDPNLPNFPLFGLVQGRDNTDSDLQSGSFHYTYMTLTNKTPPGSTPQDVGNAFSEANGLSRTSESAVWSWSLLNNDIFPQWVNSDGSKPTMQLFTQSTALYAGGDASAFGVRYPAPVTVIKLTWVPQ